MSLEPDPRGDGPSAPTFDFTFDASVADFNVPLGTYLASHPEFDAIATGALVTSRHGSGSHQLLLLLIQREAHDSMPSRWEIPGGACDHEDATLLHGLARELWEETGLLLRRVVARVTQGSGARGLGKGAEDGAVFVTRRGLRVIKYSFLVDVEQPPEIKLDPNEHQRFLWATEEECRARRVGDVDITFTMDQQTATIMEGFRVGKE
ncbi:hypothetical protein TOPH_03460 [Tolypocladium ophioglossoides CBS 100239]|uniref:Nudix hydrolase domain-containing protein n=1 Tax=Tolypocladium ophioglossoides (strain CBS 100239) TaxID=1163406 RepID=A0A0L0NCJ1_TOLOC|nr:hypothetical protein TOPH_03460 [Tolypocladium ophioglossoides CBS 100239]